ncbi:MAG: response regulator transcription factor [Flavobacteriales bacterium]|nr:response regulator transcription factor [Flavobacteriales bacterium]
MIRTVIIDDEARARKILINILAKHCDNVTIVGQADDVDTGIVAIQEHSPDLVLLDIKMPGGSGFDLLTKLDKIDFKVIFITAFEEYAVRAFKFSALDYLLKPVNSEELIAAIAKTENVFRKDDIALRLKAFMDNIDGITKEVKKIVLRTSESIHVVNIQDIVRCESERSYTWFYFTDRRKLLVAKPLNHFEELLEDQHFLRTHRSHLINFKHLKRYDKAEGGTAVMNDDSTAAVSNRKREFLLKLIEQL